ncbi:hypothetical protein JQ571_18640 [Bradyrhizobium liaoningense]|nr:hypothetical protein [Bradyrhizobium liaoningense]MBR1169007.1 hypothetical protein [Bradyrhizobium liaoningense]
MAATLLLINSLGSSWIPNNSSISSFQGHIWSHVTDKFVCVAAHGKVSPLIAKRGEQTGDAYQFTLHLKAGATELARAVPLGPQTPPPRTKSAEHRGSPQKVVRKRANTYLATEVSEG